MSDNKAFWTWEQIELVHRQAALFPKGLRKPEALTYGRIYFPASLGKNDAAYRIIANDIIHQARTGREFEAAKPLSLLEDLELPRTEWVFRPPYTRGYTSHKRYFEATGRHDSSYLTYFNNGPGLYVCAPNRLYLGSLPWDYETEPERYWGEVSKLDRTEAGRKADELVTHLLRTFYDDGRVETWRRYRYFDLHFTPHNEFDPERVISVRFQARPTLGTFILRHGRQRYGQRWQYFGDKLTTSSPTSFCLHPADPYPSGDLIVTQLMFMMGEGLYQFMKKANW